MTTTIRAIYENGIFRPLDAPNLPDQQQVRLVIESVAAATEAEKPASNGDPLANVRVSTGIADLAEQFDEYRFGRRQP